MVGPDPNSVRLSPPAPTSLTGDQFRVDTDSYDCGMTRQIGSVAEGQEAPAWTPAQRRGSGAIDIDPVRLRNATEIIESIDPEDTYHTVLHLASLSAVVMEIWESAVRSSQCHQDILAILENGVRLAQHADSFHLELRHLSAFREALSDLGQPQLVRQNVDAVRSRFLNEGFTPLGFLDTTGPEGDDSDN